MCLGTKPLKKKKGDFKEEQGANIEGLAIFGNQLFLGLRGPVLNDTAYLFAFNKEIFSAGSA